MRVVLGRLKRRAEFLRVAAAARKWAAPGLVLQAAPAVSVGDDARLEIRLGFTCSRRVGNSVERNRARRRLREAAAQVMPEAAKPGTDYVLIGRRETLDRPFALLLDDLRLAVGRVNSPKPKRNPDALPPASQDALRPAPESSI